MTAVSQARFVEAVRASPLRSVGLTGADDRFAQLLPPELAFLAGPGLPSELILSAISLAPRGSSPLEAVLADGLIGEEAYYDALARHLGCSRYAGRPAFAPDFDPVRSLRCGVAPLAGDVGPRAVIAPDAVSIPRLIEMTRSGRLDPDDFAIASPRRLAALIRRKGGQAIVREALGRLPDALSSRTGLTVRQAAVLSLAAAATAGLGWLQPVAAATALSLLLWTFFLGTIALRSVAAVADNSEPRPPLLSDDELPVYTVVVAAYREAAVAADLVRALDALDYPQTKLDIKIVVEERDTETRAEFLSLRLPPRYEIVVAPPGAPSTKPRALDVALSSARGELLVVYDAEDAPDPHQLRLAASRFAMQPDVDCLQARLTIRNSGDSWLAGLFALEYAALFDLVNPGLCALGLPIALGGTSNHFRIGPLIEAGGWDAWNVAEDADLGIRLARCGLKVGSLDSDTSEEAPHELGNWFRQRVRWQKGWMQTCMVHSRAPLVFMGALGLRRAAASALLLAGSVASALFWPIFTLDTIRRALAAEWGFVSGWREAMDLYTYGLGLAGIWAIVIPAVVAGRQRGLTVSARRLALLPAYYALISAAAWTAIYDLAVRPHYWGKTEHGRAKPRARPTLTGPVLASAED